MWFGGYEIFPHIFGVFPLLIFFPIDVPSEGQNRNTCSGGVGFGTETGPEDLPSGPVSIFGDPCVAPMRIMAMGTFLP